MPGLLISILLTLTPEALSVRSYRVREFSERWLAATTRTYAEIMALDALADRTRDAEAHRRMKRVVAVWYAKQVPFDWRRATAAEINALETARPCTGCTCELTRRYYEPAKELIDCGIVPRDSFAWPDYRLASRLWVDDMIQHRVSPLLIRCVLNLMEQRTCAWLGRPGSGYQQMPSPLP